MRRPRAVKGKFQNPIKTKSDGRRSGCWLLELKSVFMLGVFARVSTQALEQLTLFCYSRLTLVFLLKKARAERIYGMHCVARVYSDCDN